MEAPLSPSDPDARGGEVLGAVPEQASSVVLARKPFDVYLTLRPRSLKFAGGCYVFPGGGVDHLDAKVGWPPELAPSSPPLGVEAKFFAAAVREVFEEVGLLLAYDEQGRPLWQPEGAADPVASVSLREARRRLLEGEWGLHDVLARYRWRPAFDRLTYVGRWITPPSRPRRYDTRFFLADVSGCVTPQPHAAEVESARWIPLEEAVNRGELGELPLMPPTVGTLQSLIWHRDVEKAVSFFSEGSLPRVKVQRPSPAGISTWDIALEALGVIRVPVPSPTLKPWEHTNVYVVANHGEAVLIDAGDGGADGVALIDEAWSRLGRPRMKALLLTHGHPDHARGSRAVREALGAPVWAHSEEQARLATYAPSVEVGRWLEEGDTVRVGALELAILHTPGHAPGHLCFWLKPHGVLFIGDMAVADGSVWVGPPDGNLRAYLTALGRLSDLPVRLAAPSHGPVFSDVQGRLQALVRRRLERERDIVALLRTRPRSLEELVEALYRGKVPPDVMEVARRTTLGHLHKLEEEARVEPPNSPQGSYRLLEDR